jgi:uncharacterized protein (TIGR03118 family)
VSDLPGLAAITDPELKNSWGVSESSATPFWISNQGTSTSTLYTVTGSTTVSKMIINPPSGFVSIPTTAAGPQGPTGQVNNSNTSTFLVGQGGNSSSAHFIFANLNGTISAWDTGATAFIQTTTANAVYTGLAINTAQTRLYAANDAASGSIDVFNSSFAPVSLPGAFIDPHLPAGFVPFNAPVRNNDAQDRPLARTLIKPLRRTVGVLSAARTSVAWLLFPVMTMLLDIWQRLVQPGRPGRFGRSRLCSTQAMRLKMKWCRQ